MIGEYQHAVPTRLRLAYLGYELGSPAGESEGALGHFRAVTNTTVLGSAHSILYRRSAIETVVPYLEQILLRPGGNTVGGPMHVAWSLQLVPSLASSHPDFDRMGSMGNSASSRTDIAGTNWKDRLPMIGKLRKLKNSIRRE